MSRLRIVHRTEYHSTRARWSWTLAGAEAAEGHDLRVETMQLDIQLANQLAWVCDVFANSVAIVNFLEPATLLTIKSEVVVCRMRPFPD